MVGSSQTINSISDTVGEAIREELAMCISGTFPFCLKIVFFCDSGLFFLIVLQFCNILQYCKICWFFFRAFGSLREKGAWISEENI